MLKLHPQPRVKQKTRELVTTGQPNDPAFPARRFTAYSALSPVTGFLATVAGATRKRCRQLGISIGMPGPHGFAVHRLVTRQLTIRYPSHPTSNVRDDRDTPLIQAPDGAGF